MTASPGVQPASTPPTPTTSAADLFCTISAHHESSAVYTAATLGIADRLGTRTLGHRELATATGTNPEALLRLLRLLVSAGVLTETEPERFALTAKGRHLRTDVPDSLHSVALLMANPRNQQRWGELADCVREGRSVMEKERHANPFEQMPPQMLEILGKAMTFFVTHTADAVVNAYNFGRFGRLVEVGAGRGILLSAILRANPDLSGVMFDLPYMIDNATEILDPAIADRCTLIAGDFFESVPAGGDAYLLNNVIHDWSDKRSAEILTNVRRAMTAGKTLLIVETLYPDQFDVSLPSRIAARSDVNMLVNTGAKERSRNDFAELVREAGFRLERIVPVRPTWSGADTSSVVEAVAR